MLKNFWKDENISSPWKYVTNIHSDKDSPTALLVLSVIRWLPIRWFTLRDLHSRICRASIHKPLDQICNVFRDLNDSMFLCVCNNWICTKWWIYVTPHVKMNGWFNFNINNQRKKVFEARKMWFSKFSKLLIGR